MSTYNYNIQLQDIHIQNFRGFEEVDIHFDEKLTVFIGINGSGKTSILELLADILRQFLKEVHPDMSFKSALVGTKDVQIGKAESINECSLWLDLWEVNPDTGMLEPKSDECICTYRLAPVLTNIFSFKNIEAEEETNEIDEDGNKKKIIVLEPNSFENKANYSGEIMRIFRDNKDKVHVPIVAYYPCNSLSQNKAVSTNDTLLSNHVLSTYQDIMTQENISFNYIKKWFDWRQKLDFQRRAKNIENKDQAITQQIYSNILSALNDDNNNGYSEIYIDWENPENSEFVLVKNGAELRENQLSSGEKMLFTLVADISAKMAVANPTSTNPSKDGVGVVLIDEIDLHLHPKWQRKVIGKLQEIFPKVQFVLTTHSALVLQNIRSEHIRVISNGQIFGVENTYGQSIEDILENTLETDANLFEKEFSQLFDAISNNKINEAVDLKNKLSKKIEGKSAQLIRAEALINRKRLLAK